MLENESYTPKAVIHTENGLCIGVRTDNAVLQEVSVGDTIQITGTITGFLKYSTGIGVINTAGCGTDLQISGSSHSEKENLFLMICNYAQKNQYKDVFAWSDYYAAQYPDDEENIQNLEYLKDTIHENCYEGTYIKKYDVACEGITSVTELSVSDLGEGYDYADSSLSSNIQVFGTYLKNQGYQDKGLTKATVNGEEDLYELYSNSDGVNFCLAQGPDRSSMRVLVYAPDVMVQKLLAETYGSSETDSASNTYTDSETIKKVQEALNQAGYNCGTPDGIAGSGTFSALNAYQEANGLTVENAVTDELLVSLGLR